VRREMTKQETMDLAREISRHPEKYGDGPFREVMRDVLAHPGLMDLSPREQGAYLLTVFRKWVFMVKATMPRKRSQKGAQLRTDGNN
jgi:hypothetical protein